MSEGFGNGVLSNYGDFLKKLKELYNSAYLGEGKGQGRQREKEKERKTKRGRESLLSSEDTEVRY